MTAALLWAGGVCIALWFTWIIFVAIMRLKQVRDAGQLTRSTTVLGYATLAIGLLLDIAVNTLVGTVMFVEWPQWRNGEWLLSGRLSRLSAGPEGWRKRRAILIRSQLLDNIDPAGVHNG